MSLLGGLTKLAVRTVLLPVTVPVAATRDFVNSMDNPSEPSHTAATFKGIGKAVEEIAESEDE